MHMTSFPVKTSAAGDSSCFNVFLSHRNSRMRYTVHPQKEKLGRGESVEDGSSFLRATFDIFLSLSASPVYHPFLKRARKSQRSLRCLERHQFSVGWDCSPGRLGSFE